MSNPFEGLNDIGQYVLKNRSAFQMASKKIIQEVFKQFRIKMTDVFDIREDKLIMSKLLNSLKGEAPMTLEQFKAHIISTDDNFATHVGIYREIQEKKHQEYLDAQEQKFDDTMALDANDLFSKFGTQLRYLFPTFNSWLTFCFYYLNVDLNDPEIRKMLYLFDKNEREGSENDAPLRGKMWEIATTGKNTNAVLSDIFIWTRACEYYDLDQSVKILYSKAGLDHKYREYIGIEKKGKNGTMTWRRPKNTHQPELDDKIIKITRFSELGFDDAPTNKKGAKMALEANADAMKKLWTSFQDWSGFLIVGMQMSIEEATPILKEYKEGANLIKQNWNIKGMHEFIDALARWMLYTNKGGNYLLDRRLDVIQTIFGNLGCFHKFHHSINHIETPTCEPEIQKKLGAKDFEAFTTA